MLHRLFGRRPSARKPQCKSGFRPALTRLEDRDVPALTFQFDYSYDTNGFFNNPNARAALERAGDELSQYISTTLAAITPGGGNTWQTSFLDPATGNPVSVQDPTIPTGTYLIYAGGRDLPGSVAGQGGPGVYSYPGNSGSAWQNLVTHRAHSGFADWGGSVSFDTGLNWYFGTDPTGQSGYYFQSYALHELMHTIGFLNDTSDPPASPLTQFHSLISADTFTGPQSTFINQTAPALDGGGDDSHWAQNTIWGGQQAIMTPVGLPPGTYQRMTGLDYAALYDIGWNVAAAFGSKGNDTVQLSPGGGTTVNVTVTRSIGGSSSYSVDGSQGVFVDLGDGDDQLTITGSLGAVPVTVYGGGGNDVVYTPSAGQGVVFHGGTGSNTLVVQGGAGSTNFTAVPAASSTVADGYVSLTGATTSQVNFDTTVQQVNMQAGVGGTDVMNAAPSTTTTFVTLGRAGTFTVAVANGSTQAAGATENLAATPATNAPLGYGSVTLDGHKAVYFDINVQEVNITAGSGGRDIVIALPSTTTTFYVLGRGDTTTVVGANGVSQAAGASQTLMATPAPNTPGGLGSVALSGYRSVYFDQYVQQVNIVAGSGGTDVMSITPSTTNAFLAIGRAGTTTIAEAYGVDQAAGATETLTATPAPSSGYGSVALSGYQPVQFDSTVQQVNIQAGIGGIDEIKMLPSTTTTFLAAGRAGTFTVAVAYGSTQAAGATENLAASPATGAPFGYGFVTLDGHQPTYFDINVQEVNITAGAGGTDIVNALPSTTTVFYVLGYGGTTTVAVANGVTQAAGATENLVATPAPNTPGGLGSVALSGYQSVYFDQYVQQVNVVAGAGGTDVITVLPGTTNVFFALGRAGTTTVAVVNGTSGADTFTATPAPAGGYGSVTLSGYQSVHFDPTVQQVNVAGLAGNDSLTITSLNTSTALDFSGGDGTDTLTIALPPGTTPQGNLPLGGPYSGTRIYVNGGTTYKAVLFDGIEQLTEQL